MKSDPLAGLRGGAEGASRPRPLSARNLLVVGQVALSMVLLVAAFLLARSFVRMTSVPLGFEPQRVLAVKTSFSWGAEEARVHGFSREVLDRLSFLPGVVSAALVDRLPLQGESQSSPILIRDRALPRPASEVSVLFRAVSRGYFATVGIPLLAGDDLPVEPTSPAQGEGARGQLGSPVVVNEAFVRTFFGEQDPLGKWIGMRRGSAEVEPQTWYPIGGVVGDVRQSPRQTGSQPEVYLHYTSTYWPILSFVVKAQGDPAEYGTAIRALIHQVDPAQVVESVEPLHEELSQTVSSQRLQTVTLGMISALALLLAGIGLYGLLSSHVTLRTREFGIRLALGALPRQILWAALKPGLVLTLAGA
ncbi:MAG: hypothetical protein KDD47_17260, partial [Acidobacteria bacterium]|nr:hypothetical protein [Acidobacteriota bacterium]